MNIRKYIFIAHLLLIGLNVRAQSNSNNSQITFTHEFIAKIIKIDTVQIKRKSILNYYSTNDEPTVLKMKIKILTKIKGDFKTDLNLILIELKKSDHNCKFDFRQGKKYKIYAYTSKYTSSLVKSDYRKKFFTIDCHNPPVLTQGAMFNK